jgi:ATP-dependent Clp protease ATP-binding subunit ClpC
VILLDEIEKAHPDVANILLQVLEDGRMTDGKGRVVDFKNTIVIMTSNVGSSLIQQAGFTESGNGEEWEKVKKQLLHGLTEVFRPEFINRVDEIIIFHALKKEHVQKIADMMLGEVKRRVQAQGLQLDISEDVRNRLSQDGFDPHYGARPLRREIQRRLENQLSTVLLTGQFKKGSAIRALLKGDEIVFEQIGGKKTAKTPKTTLQSKV